MKILIISPRFPYEQGKADSMTVFHFIQFLAKRGHEVVLATFTNNEDFPETERQKVYNLCSEVQTVALSKWRIAYEMGLNFLKDTPFQVAYYKDPRMQKNIDNLIKKHQPDLIYGHLIRVAEYIKDHKETPRILAMQIAQTLNYRRLIRHERSWFRKLFYTQEYHRVTKMEPEIIDYFERVLIISPHDKKAISPRSNADKIFFNPHGIAVDYFSQNLNLKREKNVIVMNGDFGVPTNIDGALYFYEKIYPLIKKVNPDVKLWLVGRNPATVILNLQKDESVTVTGKVPDIRPYLQQATVAIAPVRAAAGLQNKILVSLASQLPVVATPTANEGIGAPENEVLMVGHSATDFAEKITMLFQNSMERKRLGKNALQFMKDSWTWDFHFEKLEEMMEKLVLHHEKSVENYYPFKQKGLEKESVFARA